MLTCTFISQDEVPSWAVMELRQMIELLVNRYGVTMFYVGDRGKFDRIATAILEEFKTAYKVVVLSDEEFSQRKQMIEKSDFVVTNMPYLWGEAGELLNHALQLKKSVVNISEI